MTDEVAINAVTRFEVEDGIAVVTLDSPPVNALGAAVRQGIDAAVKRADADRAVQATVLICGGRTFFAGADITEFGKPPVLPSLRDIQTTIEGAAKPVVAAIHGTALGGGLELALVAAWRVAVPSAKLGLPEVKLGLLPGAGGTQRLPRVVGVEKALEMVTGGAPIGAAEAQGIGLIDAVAAEGDLRRDAIAFARERVTAGERPVPVRDRDQALQPARDDAGVFDRFRAANARRFKGFKAPEANIRAVEAAVALPFADGLVRERALFDELMADGQSAAQRHLFFAERQAAKIAGLPRGTQPLPVAAVGIVGAGTMGGGIAMAFADAGLPVTLVETTQAALDRGIDRIRTNYEASAAKGRLTAEQVEGRMARITPTLSLDDLADADLIVEAVFEDAAVKRDLFIRLDAVAKPGAILATNTSYLDIAPMAAATGRPHHVLGLHFFSPANVMKLLEIVRTGHTAPAVLATAVAVAGRIGKVAVVVGNAWGFVGNRMLAARDAQVNALLLEGAEVARVDAVLRDFGFPMGHLEMRDLVGLDVGWNAATSTGATVRERLNEMGRHGQKGGGGYYDYDDRRRATPSPVAAGVIAAVARDRGVDQRTIDDDEIRDRMLLALVNEGARILDEGGAARASDIDVVWVTGYGFPRYRGGPMFWSQADGLDRAVARLRELERLDPAFAPAPLLERLAAEGGGFPA